MHAVLEDIVHVAVLQAIADAAGVALGRTLAAIGDADLVEIAHQIAVTARQRSRQRVVEDQEIRDQPRFQGFPVDPVVGGQRRHRAQDRGPLIVIERAADMLFLGQQHVKYHVLLPEEEHVGGPLDYYQWTSILRSVSALTAYHWVYRETLKPWLIADLLILNDSLPRSLASCYGNLVRNLDQIGVAYGRQGAAQRHARGVRNRLEHSNMDDIFQHGVHEFIQEFILDNGRLGEIIAKQYLI